MAGQRRDRPVAIKVLHSGERFLSESKTTVKLQHPHILTLLDSGEAAGLLLAACATGLGESTVANGAMQ